MNLSHITYSQKPIFKRKTCAALEVMLLSAVFQTELLVILRYLPLILPLKQYWTKASGSGRKKETQGYQGFHLKFSRRKQYVEIYVDKWPFD